MALEPLPAECRLLRYASGGQTDGLTVDGSAFKPRPVDEGKLSVHMRGVFDGNLEEDLRTIRYVKSRWMTIRATGRFAEISRAAIEKCAIEAVVAFEFWRDPLVDLVKPSDPSHSLIEGIPDGDDDAAIALRDMIAISVEALHPAVSD